MTPEVRRILNEVETVLMRSVEWTSSAAPAEVGDGAADLRVIDHELASKFPPLTPGAFFRLFTLDEPETEAIAAECAVMNLRSKGYNVERLGFTRPPPRPLDLSSLEYELKVAGEVEPPPCSEGECNDPATVLDYDAEGMPVPHCDAHKHKTP
jgi:hypothetical protein